MEQSKSISLVIAKLKIAYPYYFKELTQEEIILLTQMYQDQLKAYSNQTLINAVDEIIKTSKFMPTISEIVESCEKNKVIRRNEVIEKMKLDGYFKNANEIEKVYHFLEVGIIPTWLKEDMKKYVNQNSLLVNRNLKMIKN